MKRLRFGVIGCGAISTLYQLPALRRCSLLDLVAVVDRDRAWADSVARQFEVAHAYADFRPLIGTVDAVLIATPNSTHADIACALLDAGVHVLCEKPMATTRGDVERMQDAARATGARLMAAHCSRFSPNLSMLKRIIDAGWLGHLEQLSAGIGSPYESVTQRTDFRRQKALSGGGVLIDLGVHLIDLTVWFAGHAAASVAYEASFAPGWEVETDAEVGLGFPSGARAVLAASFTRALESTFTVRGSDGWAVAHWYRPTELTLYSATAKLCQRGGPQQLQLSEAPMYDRQIRHFCEGVLSGGNFLVRDEEVLASADVIERCYRSGAAAASATTGATTTSSESVHSHAAI